MPSRADPFRRPVLWLAYILNPVTATLVGLGHQRLEPAMHFLTILSALTGMAAIMVCLAKPSSEFASARTSWPCISNALAVGTLLWAGWIWHAVVFFSTTVAIDAIPHVHQVKIAEAKGRQP